MVIAVALQVLAAALVVAGVDLVLGPGFALIVAAVAVGFAGWTLEVAAHTRSADPEGS